MPTLQAKNRRKLGLKTLDERALADTLGPRKHERPRHHHIGEKAVFIEQRRAEARMSAGDIGQAARNGEVEDSGVLHSHVRVLTEAIDQRIGVSASVAAASMAARNRTAPRLSGRANQFGPFPQTALRLERHH